MYVQQVKWETEATPNISEIQSVPLATETGISLIILPLVGGPLLRVATIRRTADTHCRHIPLHFSHNERTPVQISLQYLQCRVR
jgi:hypothetical protein